MIFYFSGTGNSFWAAKKLGETFDEKPVSIAEELNKPANTFTYNIQSGERIFFVFPVHAWGPAVLVLRFIKQLHIAGYSNQPVYAVCTCGDEACHTDKIMRRLLAKRHIVFTKAYTISMPNNYILLPGFDTDPKKLEQEKLQQAPIRLRAIIDDVNTSCNSKLYNAGGLLGLKSYVIYPLFRKFGLRSRPFYAKDNCTSCALCVKVCPTRTISFVDGKPHWGNGCVQCLACIHYCPIRAIEYGIISRKKGRYHYSNSISMAYTK